jgi:hypothetical protein
VSTFAVPHDSTHPRSEEPSHPQPLEITTAAVHRATGTSLGSICLGAGIVATVRVVGRTAAELKRITSPKSQILPSPLMFFAKLTPLFAIVAGVLDQLNGSVTGQGQEGRKAAGLYVKRLADVPR